MRYICSIAVSNVTWWSRARLYTRCRSILESVRELYSLTFRNGLNLYKYPPVNLDDYTPVSVDELEKLFQSQKERVLNPPPKAKPSGKAKGDETATPGAGKGPS